jgi:hypothetical protein
MSEGTEALAIIFFASAAMDAHWFWNARSKIFRAHLFSATVQVIRSIEFIV